MALPSEDVSSTSRGSLPGEVLLYGDNDSLTFLNAVFRSTSRDKDDTRTSKHKGIVLEAICERTLKHISRFEKEDNLP
ncbi:hypothetical protein DFQ28_006231 [Apophysomyces sp. BC1034]|nr:hypothetical protein DFQ29_004349 [Apophysomyces sp. BC1021]KAG0187539.1 hypothetical protein DFQ28_006231 [Apophysomyces sp. BC1034]